MLIHMDLLITKALMPLLWVYPENSIIIYAREKKTVEIESSSISN